MRKFHRVAGTVLAIFVISSALTGMTWAMSQHIYWKRDYLKPKRTIDAPPLTSATVSAVDAIAIAHARAAVSASLRTEGGMLLWDVVTKQGKANRSTLIDARTGRVMTPLTSAEARAIAAQYVRVETPDVERVDYAPKWISRRNDAPRAAYVVRYRTPRATEITIDAESGRILEEYDPARRFHFFIQRLHQLDYFGTDKFLTLIPGLGLLTMTLTGLFLLPRRKVARVTR
jgi:uncharacterized iron-regulated membrane protein